MAYIIYVREAVAKRSARLCARDSRLPYEHLRSAVHHRYIHIITYYRDKVTPLLGSLLVTIQNQYLKFR